MLVVKVDSVLVYDYCFSNYCFSYYSYYLCSYKILFTYSSYVYYYYSLASSASED